MKKSLIASFLVALTLIVSACSQTSNNNSDEGSTEIWNPADHPTAYNCDTLESTISLGGNDPADASQDNPAMLWYNYWCQ